GDYIPIVPLEFALELFDLSPELLVSRATVPKRSRYAIRRIVREYRAFPEVVHSGPVIGKDHGNTGGHRFVCAADHAIRPSSQVHDGRCREHALLEIRVGEIARELGVPRHVFEPAATVELGPSGDGEHDSRLHRFDDPGGVQYVDDWLVGGPA